MKTLNYVKCSPGGNITTLVFTQVPRFQQPEIAKQIMAHQPDVEQVGFIEKPEHPDAIARLQMMGGEFCGNATRSIGWVLATENDAHFKGEKILTLEVSGAKRLLQVQVSERDVTVEMPIKHELTSVKHIGDKTIVDLEGISHVIVEQSPPLHPKNEANRLLDELGLKTLEAAGVLYCVPHKNGILMTPIVWVRDTGTLIEETACASGTVCIALAQAAVSNEKQTVLQVYQPSGGIISASVEKKDGAFSKAFIKGPVKILERGAMDIEKEGQL